MHPCNAGSHVAEFGYDPAARELGVKFANAPGVWTYEDVGPDIFESFMASPSPGRFLNAVLVPNFKVRAP